MATTEDLAGLNMVEEWMDAHPERFVDIVRERSNQWEISLFHEPGVVVDGRTWVTGKGTTLREAVDDARSQLPVEATSG